jgi:dihydrofolate synthase / folylpolyglutamate synthase
MVASFENGEEALQWLYSQQQLGVKLGLENVRRLLAAAGLSEKEMRFVHVAGTNGKGSTCAFIHSLLVAAGERGVGLFTSPHLVRFNERIRGEVGEIPGADLQELLGQLRALTRTWPNSPTFFELALVLGVLWFKKQKCTWAVMETGLGGRLDATNVVLPEVCVITRIGMDHMEMLGPTLADIAAEKAGIIKPGVPVVTGPQEAVVMQVLERVANERQAPLIQVTEPWTASEIGLSGEHQCWNAALAVAAVRALPLCLEESVLRQALAETRWPGRFEQLPNGVILDGAHNEDGMAALVNTWKARQGAKRATVVVGMVREKAVDAMLERLSEVVGRWIVSGFQSPRALSPGELSARLQALGVTAPIEEHDRVQDALAAAQKTGEPVIVCGSLYLVGEARSLLVDGSAGFERSSQ